MAEALKMEVLAEVVALALAAAMVDLVLVLAVMAEQDYHLI
jgi:hypothetical protein